MGLVFVNRFFYPNYSATSQILTDLCFALATCILRQAGDASLARQWGENGRAVFDRGFSEPIAISRWEQVLTGVSRS